MSLIRGTMMYAAELTRWPEGSGGGAPEGDQPDGQVHFGSLQIDTDRHLGRRERQHTGEGPPRLRPGKMGAQTLGTPPERGRTGGDPQVRRWSSGPKTESSIRGEARRGGGPRFWFGLKSCIYNPLHAARRAMAAAFLNKQVYPFSYLEPACAVIVRHPGSPSPLKPSRNMRKAPKKDTKENTS